jgi:hypothetical protein
MQHALFVAVPDQPMERAIAIDFRFYRFRKELTPEAER